MKEDSCDFGCAMPTDADLITKTGCGHQFLDSSYLWQDASGIVVGSWHPYNLRVRSRPAYEPPNSTFTFSIRQIPNLVAEIYLRFTS